MKNHIVLAAPTTCYRRNKVLQDGDTVYVKWDEVNKQWIHRCLGHRQYTEQQKLKKSAT